MGQLKGIELTNFRIFENRTRFEFAPITIVTGKNNSGKSALLKGLQLLKDNIKDGEHLWSLNVAGSGIRTGSFSNLCNFNSKGKHIVFKIPIVSTYFESDLDMELCYIENNTSPERSGTLYYVKIIIENKNLVSVFPYGKDSGDILKEHEISNNENNVGTLFEINLSYFKEKYDIMNLQHTKDQLQLTKDEYDAKVNDVLKSVISFDNEINEYFKERAFYNNVFNNFFHRINVHSDSIINEISKEDENLLFNYSNLIQTKNEKTVYKTIMEKFELEELKKLQNIEKTLLQKASDAIFFADSLDDEFESSIEHTIKKIILKKYLLYFTHVVSEEIEKDILPEKKSTLKLSSYGQNFFHSFLNELLSDIFSNFKNSFKDLYYIEASRGMQDRSFHDEMNYLTFPRLLREYTLNGFSKECQQSVFINKWIKAFGFGDALEVIRDSATRVTSLYILKENHKLSLADMGNGVAQLIPILMQIAIQSWRSRDQETQAGDNEFYRSSILYVEEPENSLHPNLQSLLAEMIIDAGQTFNIQFIIETHSEYLIRRFQLSVAEKKILSRDCIIYYVNDSLSDIAKDNLVEKIRINDEGGLTANFGPGFYDEAINLKIEILKLKNQNN